MTFRPSMTSVREGVTTIEPLKWRAWHGVVADLWHARCQSGARAQYVSPHPRIFVVMDLRGGDFETRLRPADDPAPRLSAGTVSYIPAQTPIWARIPASLVIKHLDIHFDPDVLSERLHERIERCKLIQPRLSIDAQSTFRIASMISEEVANPTPRHDLYGDSLSLALLVDIFDIGRSDSLMRSRMSVAHLRRVTDYMDEHCCRALRLQELANLVGLSQSHFSHSFKAATGLPPHKWQMQARIRKAQELLVQTRRSLTELSADLGFSDQAHFTRVFRRTVGETPAVWRRCQTLTISGARHR